MPTHSSRCRASWGWRGRRRQLWLRHRPRPVISTGAAHERERRSGGEIHKVGCAPSHVSVARPRNTHTHTETHLYLNTYGRLRLVPLGGCAAAYLIVACVPIRPLVVCLRITLSLRLPSVRPSPSINHWPGSTNYRRGAASTVDALGNVVCWPQTKSRPPRTRGAARLLVRIAWLTLRCCRREGGASVSCVACRDRHSRSPGIPLASVPIRLLRTADHRAVAHSTRERRAFAPFLRAAQGSVVRARRRPPGRRHDEPAVHQQQSGAEEVRWPALAAVRLEERRALRRVRRDRRQGPRAASRDVYRALGERESGPDCCG